MGTVLNMPSGVLISIGLFGYGVKWILSSGTHISPINRYVVSTKFHFPKNSLGVHQFGFGFAIENAFHFTGSNFGMKTPGHPTAAAPSTANDLKNERREFMHCTFCTGAFYEKLFASYSPERNRFTSSISFIIRSLDSSAGKTVNFIPSYFARGKIQPQ